MQKLMTLAPPLSLTMPEPSADTWQIEWQVLKLKLTQFQHHYNGAGKLHSVGSLDEDAVFMAMVNGTAKKQFIKEVVHHRRQRQPKAPKISSFIIQEAPDVNYLVIVFSPMVRNLFQLRLDLMLNTRPILLVTYSNQLNYLCQH